MRENYQMQESRKLAVQEVEILENMKEIITFV